MLMARFQIALTTLVLLAGCATVGADENREVARGEYLVKIDIPAEPRCSARSAWSSPGFCASGRA